jgi:hypothetical protein
MPLHGETAIVNGKSGTSSTGSADSILFRRRGLGNHRRGRSASRWRQPRQKGSFREARFHFSVPLELAEGSIRITSSEREFL